MSRIPDKPVVLPDILFETGKWDLQVQYQDSLQGLIQRLDANKNIVIELAPIRMPELRKSIMTSYLKNVPRQ
ncbi:MAG: hypothetical protein U5L09_19580 [Bacteroidales bacterium]|nr:hypothetical protein [Bacteroidales bacterium]